MADDGVCNVGESVPATPILSDRYEDRYCDVIKFYIKPNFDSAYPRTPNETYIVPSTVKCQSPSSSHKNFKIARRLFQSDVRRNLQNEFDYIAAMGDDRCDDNCNVDGGPTNGCVID